MRMYTGVMSLRWKTGAVAVPQVEVGAQEGIGSTDAGDVVVEGYPTKINVQH